MDDKSLDNIFKTAFNSKSKISQEKGDWESFALKLKERQQRKNFFRFALNRFNIYYVGLFLVCLVGFGLTMNPAQRNVSKDNIDKNNMLPKDTASLETATPGQEVTSVALESQKKSQVHNSSNNQSIPDSKNAFVDTLTEKPIIKESLKDNDSTKSIPGPTEIIAPKSTPVVIRKKKTVVVVTPPQDTIIQIDTVKVRKGRRK